MLTEPQTLAFDLPDGGDSAATHRLAVYDRGGGYPLFCIHGLTRNGRDFDFLAGALAAERHVFCPDMPGRGKSDWRKDPAQYNYPAYVADILALARALGITRMDWIGTSMGGIIGMMVANAAPGLIRSLVLNDIGCVVSAVGLKRIASYAGVEQVFSTRAAGEAALRERCAPYGIRGEDKWQHLFRHSLAEAPDGMFRFAYDPAIAAGLPKADAIADINLWPLWEAVKTLPVLLLRGAESDLLTHDTALAMQANHPALTLHEIPHVGHAPALMENDQIELVTNWLREKVK